MLSIKTFHINLSNLIKAPFPYHNLCSNQKNLRRVTSAVRIVIHQLKYSLNFRCIIKNGY